MKIRSLICLLVGVLSGPCCLGQSAPLGHFGVATEGVVGGWVYDPDLGYNPVLLEVASGTSVILSRPANLLRNDLPGWVRGRHHGFVLPLPPLGPGSHVLEARAIDEAGIRHTLGQRTVNVQYTNPGGRIESIELSATTLTVRGWAFDGDAQGAPIYVHLYVDNQYQAFSLANRNDPLTAPLGSSLHGFEFSVPRPKAGLHEVSVAAINVGPGYHQWLRSVPSTTVDAREHLAPLGARRSGVANARHQPGTGIFSFEFDDGEDPRNYLVDTSDPAVLKGLITVWEARSGTRPVHLGGTGFRDPSGSYHWPESILANPTFDVALVRVDFDGDTLSLRYRETVQAATQFKNVSYRLRGKSLLVEVGSEGAVAPSVGNYFCLHFGRCSMPDARSVSMPYMSTPLIVGPGVFTTAYVDPAQSGANLLHLDGPLTLQHPTPGLRHQRFPWYAPDSSGSVSPLAEHLYVTVSARPEDTFPSPGAGAAPYRESTVPLVVYDTWGVDRSILGRQPGTVPFHEQAAHFQSLRHAYGMTDVMVLRHKWGHGDDWDLPKFYPATSGAGGDVGFAALAQSTKSLGWRFAAHEDASAMMPPNSVVGTPTWYDPALLSRTATLEFRALGGLVLHGQFLPAFAVRPDRQPDLGELHASYLRSTYGTDATFWDVQPYLLPMLDFDAANPASRTFAQGIAHVKETARRYHAVHQGPISGECYVQEFDDSILYAGYVDALEREVFGGEDGLVIPDFELRSIQPVQVNQGMGYLGRFFQDTTRSEQDFPAARHHDLVRSRTVAYGHVGFISDTLLAAPQFSVGPLSPSRVFAQQEILKEYYLFQALQVRMLQSRATAILYHDGTARTLAERLLELRTASSDQVSFRGLVAQHLKEPRVTVFYENGLEVHVNASRSQWWYATVQGVVYALPPSGWVARKTSEGDDFTAWTARYGSAEVSSHVQCPEYYFHDDRQVRYLTIIKAGQTPVFVPY